jgi:broad specificity phosphatase PhoE
MDSAAIPVHAPFYLITHPDVVISREVPVPRWPLSERGLARMRAGLRQPWLQGVSAIYSSTEQKAIDAARILGEHLGLPWTEVEDLGENDRSATGFLPPPEFEATADLFFRHAEESVRGWERAVDAQARIIGAVARALAEEPDTPTIFVGHGGVGTLLQCFCQRAVIARVHDQPAGGGNHYCFDFEKGLVLYGWRSMETPPEPLA